MDLTDIKVIKSILAKHNARPNKYLGQHFLIDGKVLQEIIETAAISKKGMVLEIGPGLGVLTLELAKRAKKVIAVEKDQKMAEILKEILASQNIKNVEVIIGDILKISNFSILHSRATAEDGQFPRPTSHGRSPGGRAISKYKVVANLPYYLTARVIRKLLELPNPPVEMLLMIQKEVGERICSRPPRLRRGFGGQARLRPSGLHRRQPASPASPRRVEAGPKLPLRRVEDEASQRGEGFGGQVGGQACLPARQAKMNLLAVSVQFYGEPQIIAYVSRKSFWPEPEVDSAILKIEVSRKKTSEIDPKTFFKIVRAGFSSPRKKLSNNLLALPKIKNRQDIENLLEKIGLRADCRAQDLSVDNWHELVSRLKNFII